MPPQLEKNHVVPTSWQDEALARDGVSWEVPCSALKGETVPDSLPATPKSPPTGRGPPRGTPRAPAPLPLSPFSPADRDRRGDSPAWSGRGSQPSRCTSLYRLSPQGLANTLPRRRAGALCKQTGREERLGAGEDETFHAKREAGLLWELEGEAKVLKGAGSRRP